MFNPVFAGVDTRNAVLPLANEQGNSRRILARACDVDARITAPHETQQSVGPSPDLRAPLVAVLRLAGAKIHKVKMPESTGGYFINANTVDRGLIPIPTSHHTTPERRFLRPR